MNDKTCVGRIGGLAVALGVGLAIATAPGVAWAEPTDGANPSSSEDSGAVGKTADKPHQNHRKALATKRSLSAADRVTDPMARASKRDGTTAKAAKADRLNSLPTHMTSGRTTPKKPKDPEGSPLEAAAFALSRNRRLTEAKDPAVDNARSLATAAATQTNSAPVVLSQPTGRPDAVSGRVAGTVLASDPGPLTYTVAGAPSGGAVTVARDTGAYVYAPTQATRVLAYPTSAIDTDTFTVAVSNGQQTMNTPVSVYISPARYENRASIAVANKPSGVAVGTTGTRMYVANTGSDSVSVIDTATNTLIDTNPSANGVNNISVGNSPGAVAVNGNRLYVANSGGTVSVINTDTNTRIDANPSPLSTDISVGNSPSALAANGNRLYVANRGSGTISVINTDTNTVIDTNPTAIGVNNITVGSSPSALAVNGNKLYVANTGSGTISVINTDTNTVIDTNPTAIGVNNITVGSSPSALAVNGNKLYVANTGSGTISVINTDTYTRIDADPTSTSMDIRVDASPSAVSFSPDGSLAYVAHANDTVTVITTKDNKVFATINVDTAAENGGHAIAVSPDGTRIYVTDAVDRTVRVIELGRLSNSAPFSPGSTVPGVPDPVTGMVTGRINVQDADQDRLTYSLTSPPAGGSTVTIDQETGSFIYTPTQAARDQASATSGFDYDTFSVLVSDGIASTSTSVRVLVAPTSPPDSPAASTSVQVGSGPSGSAVSGGFTYVINYDSNNVSVIDNATRQVVTRLDVGTGPLSVAANPSRNRVYVSNSMSNTISVIDTSANTVIDTVPVIVLPGSFYNPEISYDPVEYPNRVTEVAASSNRLYINGTDGRTTVIDTSIDPQTGKDRNTVVRVADTGTFNDLDVSADGTKLYGTSAGGLSVINTATMTGVGVTVGPVWDHNVQRSESTTGVGNVAVNSTGTRAYVTYTAMVVERGVGGQSSGYFISDAQGQTWMVTGSYSAVSVIDTNPMSDTYNKEIARIVVPLGVQDAAVGGSELYVTSNDGRSVTVIDTATNTLTAVITTDDTASGWRAIYLPDNEWYAFYPIAAYTRYVTVATDGTVYVTDYTDGKLYISQFGTINL